MDKLVIVMIEHKVTDGSVYSVEIREPGEPGENISFMCDTYEDALALKTKMTVALTRHTSIEVRGLLGIEKAE